MKRDAFLVAPRVQCILATGNLERIADHVTNIAEDIVFWLRGLDFRHNKSNAFTLRNFAAPSESV